MHIVIGFNTVTVLRVRYVIGLGQLRLKARSAYMQVNLWSQGRAYKRSQLYMALFTSELVCQMLYVKPTGCNIFGLLYCSLDTLICHNFFENRECHVS